MKLIGLKNCDTVRRARKELDMAGVVYEYTDVRADGLTTADVRRWLRELGEEILNKRGATWRVLSAQKQAAAMQPDGLEALLVAHPLLVKRPVIEHDDGEITVGWTPNIKGKFGL